MSVFTLIGDSNVKTHMNPMNCRDRPLMSGAQVLTCGRLEVLAESLKQIRQESNVCLFSCVTNFLTRSEGSPTIVLRVEPVLIDFLAKLEVLCNERPDMKVLVCPPMYRFEPLWYRDNLPQIMSKFSEVFSRRSGGIMMMPSFANPVLEDDGVHLTAYSGLEFVLHLFDSACSVMEHASLEPELKTIVNTEHTRVLEDRLMAVEQDHKRLNKVVELKTAIDSELSDYHENLRNENWFIILGLPKIDPKIDRKEWQVTAKANVNEALKALMNKEYPIVVVQNITSKGKDAICRYQVLMTSVSDSKEIRDSFGAFFVGAKGKDARPPALKSISISNRITPATQVRLSLLRLQARRYEASNPGGQAFVKGYDPRPIIRIVPPADSSDPRIRTFNFIEAMESLPTNFSKSDLKPILEKINSKLFGKLRSLFMVISDDMLPSRGRQPSAGAGKSGKTSKQGNKQNNKRGHSESPGSASGSVAKSSKNSKS